MPSSYGTIKALSANIGPNNSEFTINKNNGKTNFKIDDPTYTQNQVSTEFTTNIGLNIISGDKNSDALQKIDGWISEKLCSKPPSGSFRSGHKTTTLLSAINETETTISVNSSNGLLINNLILIQSEKMIISGISKNNLTVVRGYNGSTAASHVANTIISFLGFGTTLSSDIDNSVSSINVVNSSELYINYIINIENEKLLITNISGSILTVERGVLGTTAAAHSNLVELNYLNNLASDNYYSSINYLQFFWTNPEQFELGFLETNVPQISSLKLDYISNSSNTHTSDSNKNDNFSSGNYTTTLTSSISNTDTVLQVVDGNVFGVGDLITINSEKMLVKNKSTTSLIVERNIMGTTASSHNASDIVSTFSQTLILENISDTDKPKIDSVRIYLEGSGTSKPSSTLAGSVSSSTQTIILNSSSGFIRDDRISIGNEKMLILGGLTTTLANNITKSSTSITVSDDTNFASGDMILIGNEKMVIASKPGGNVLNVSRGDDTTVVLPHLANDIVINTKITGNTLYVKRGVNATSYNSGTVVNSCTYNAYPNEIKIMNTIRYDFRIYYSNKCSQGNTNYLVFNFPELITSSVGVPNHPTSVSANVASTTTSVPGSNNTGSEKLTVSWTKPEDHNLSSPEVQTTPFISSYKIYYIPTSTSRFNNFGVLYDKTALSSSELIQYNPTVESSLSIGDVSTNDNLINLYPNTEYTIKVAAKNMLNANYSIYSSTTTATTKDVSPPNWLSSSDANKLDNDVALRSPYSSSGGYTMNGSTAIANIINMKNIDGTNSSLVLKTTTATSIRTNNTIADGSSVNLGIVSALGGNQGSEETVSKEIPVFKNETLYYLQNQIIDSGTKVSLRIENENDHYYKLNPNNPSFHGFYKSVDIYAKAKNPTTNFPASINQYSLQVKYVATGGSTYNGGDVIFNVDDLNIAPSVDINSGIIGNVGGSNSIEQISGVYVYNTNAIFRTQFNITEIGHYFLRNDKKHADVKLIDQTDTIYGNNKSLTQSDINTSDGQGGTHFYYNIPEFNTYYTSTTKHNTSGIELIASSDNKIIQFCSVYLSLSGVTDKYTDDLRLSVTPYSLYGTGIERKTLQGGYMNITNGTRKYIRVDTQSITHKTTVINDATNSKGEHINSKTGQFPSTLGSTYDHTQSIFSGDYAEELQLVNGTFRVPLDNEAYKNYSTDYYNSNGQTNPNYLAVDVSGTTYRYVSFKYTNIIGSSGISKIRLTLNGTGLNNMSINPSSPGSGNHRLYIKVVSSNSSYTTPWLDAMEAIPGTGIGSGSANGIGCLDTVNSTNLQRDCYIITGTTNATVYVRLGLKGNQNASTKISYINVAVL